MYHPLQESIYLRICRQHFLAYRIITEFQRMYVHRNHGICSATRRANPSTRTLSHPHAHAYTFHLSLTILTLGFVLVLVPSLHLLSCPVSSSMNQRLCLFLTPSLGADPRAGRRTGCAPPPAAVDEGPEISCGDCSASYRRALRWPGPAH